MPTYVSVAATRTVISDPFNPADLVVCGSRQQQSLDDTLDGDVRYYAGGIAEGTVRVMDQRTMPLTLVHLSSVQVSQLRDWRGQTVLVRTVDGERFFAVYFATSKTRRLWSTPEDSTPESVTFDVDITFTRVSFDETLL